MTTLVLVRHGETEWNRNGRWQGHTNVPLSAAGREQARRLAERLKAEGAMFDHIYASDLHRAFETAEIIATALGLAVHPLIELREIDIGAWSGLTSDEIRARYAEEWAFHEQGTDFRRGGHGETLQEFQTRVARVADQLVRTHPGQRLLVATHGGTVRALLHYVAQLTGYGMDTPIGNTSLTEVVFEDGTVRIVRANDTAHLAELRVTETGTRV
jgi:broad specificity phosphatase PhoE